MLFKDYASNPIPTSFLLQTAILNNLHCKKEMVTLTLLRLSQVQLNDMSSPTLSYPILLGLKACGKIVECLQ